MTTTHLPSHRGKILTGRVAEVGERITCPACRKALAWYKDQAVRYGEAAIESINGNPPEAYRHMVAGHAGMIAAAAAHAANRSLGYL